MEGRTRIQTLFLKALSDQISTDFRQYLPRIADYLDAHPDSQLKGSVTKCEGNQCEIRVNFCDTQNSCEEILLAALPRRGGGLITAKEIPAGTYPGALLWPDLEGQPKTTTISTWLKENRFACSGLLPYQELNQSP